MSKNLHDIDDLFRSRLEGYEESPSPVVRERIQAALEKTNADRYKKRFTGWKRVSLILLLVLLGFALYETGRIPLGSDTPSNLSLVNQLNSSASKKDKIISGSNASDVEVTDKDNKQLGLEGITTVDRITNRNSIDNRMFPVEGDIDENISNQRFSRNKFGLEAKEEGIEKSILDPHNLECGIPQWPIRNDQIKNAVSIRPELLSSERMLSVFKPFWLVTGFASYEGTGYRLDSDYPTNISNIKHSEVHEPSFSIGVLATRQLRRQWGIQSGLIYSMTQIGISPQKLYALQDPAGDISYRYNTSSGYAYIKPGLGAAPSLGDSINTAEGKHKLKFLSVPIIVKYSFGKNKFTFSPGVGVQANFLTSALVETEFETPSNSEIVFIDKLNGAKTFYLSVVADAEFRYKLNHNLSLSIRPSISFAASPSTENNVVETFPHSVSIGLGLTRRF